jgi:hypothetical protein
LKRETVSSTIIRVQTVVLKIRIRSLDRAGATRLAAPAHEFKATEDVSRIVKVSNPQNWATIPNNLGTALAWLGERQGGAEGARRLAAAVETLRQALTVQTSAHLPQGWAITQYNLGLALQIQIRLEGFPTGLERGDRLARAEGIRDDPVAQALLQTLALVCQVAAERHAEASRAFASLVGLVERQPDHFHLVWDWTLLRKLIAESKVPALASGRESLQKLIDAGAGDTKAAILAGLNELKDAFTARAAVPKKPATSSPAPAPASPARPDQTEPNVRTGSNFRTGSRNHGSHAELLSSAFSAEVDLRPATQME